MTHIQKMEIKEQFDAIKKGNPSLMLWKDDGYTVGDKILFQNNREEFETEISEMITDSCRGLKTGWVAFIIKPIHKSLQVNE